MPHGSPFDMLFTGFENANDRSNDTRGAEFAWTRSFEVGEVQERVNGGALRVRLFRQSRAARTLVSRRGPCR